MNRKKFLKTSALGLGMTGFLPNFAFPQNPQEQEASPYNPDLVKEFVVAGHKSLSQVKSMIKEFPNLIYSRYDWGNGDFEEAIEGAGHVGNKEIANYLISKGARVNLFVLCMLGKTKLIIPTLEAYPELIFAKGPHGFTLLHHAKIGGSTELANFLRENGLKDSQFTLGR